MAERKDKIITGVRQLFSYFFVGGGAALVEWGTFYLFDKIVRLDYLLATGLSFLLATFANWILGRCLTFRNAGKSGTHKEILAVYLVSAVGLGFNLLLMYLLVNCMSLPDLLAKIVATGIVFFWNFLSRKLFIYKI